MVGNGWRVCFIGALDELEKQWDDDVDALLQSSGKAVDLTGTWEEFPSNPAVLTSLYSPRMDCDADDAPMLSPTDIKLKKYSFKRTAVKNSLDYSRFNVEDSDEEEDIPKTGRRNLELFDMFKQRSHGCLDLGDFDHDFDCHFW